MSLQQSNPKTRPRRARTRKLALFCPDCQHASPLDGDWSISKTDGRYRVQCPECGTFAVDRPRL